MQEAEQRNCVGVRRQRRRRHGTCTRVLRAVRLRVCTGYTERLSECEYVCVLGCASLEGDYDGMGGEHLMVRRQQRRQQRR